jgi:hypothetical protein
VLNQSMLARAQFIDDGVQVIPRGLVALLGFG